MTEFIRRHRETAGVFVVVLLGVLPITSQASMSTNFEVSNQQLNNAGGRSSSASFIVDDCLAPDPIAGGTSASASFQVISGCGAVVGGVPSTPTPSATATLTPTSTPTDTPTETPTPVPTTTPTQSPTLTPTQTPTITATNSPTVTGTATSSTTPTATSTPTPTPFCGDGEVNGQEQCDPTAESAACCSSSCSFEPEGTSCEDGDPITCPDQCDGAGACLPGHDESTACRNTCCDGVDNDGDQTTDIEDANCGLGQEARFAVVTTSPKRSAIRMGGRVNIASLDLEVDRPDCDEPYTYRTQAGVCGEQMSLRKNGESGFVATLATPSGSGTQPVAFGKGFDIRSHWVSIGMPASSQEPPPIVGGGTCNPGGLTCTQPLAALAVGVPCPSASAGACCQDVGAVCEGRADLFTPGNPSVITDGSHPDYARCQNLRTQLEASSDAVAALVPNHPTYHNVDDPERIRVLPNASVPGNCDAIEDPDACTAACASSCTVLLGAGQQVLYVDSIDAKRNTELRLCRDFNLTESDPPTVAIFRIEGDFKLSPGARIRACGIPPDRILWNAEGEKGSVKFARGADLIGTVLAPRRKAIKFGGDATLEGSLFAPKVSFSKFTEMFHYPFSAGFE